MSAQPNWINGLGFRHLIEDGVAILQGRPIGPDRRRYVLDDLSELVLRAKRGSDLVRSNALFVASADRSAVESFSVIDRFLDEAESDHWKAVLEQAEEALKRLRTGGIPQDQSREAAIILLQRILSGLTREPKPGVPSQPEEIRIGG
ncbi:MAG: hypothetical protein ACXU8R_08695 [Xanthobacteraceae bacterium]